MNANDLLDAFGCIEDRFIVPEAQPRVISWRRRAVVLAAAVLIVSMCVGTAMAVSEGFRDLVFSIFHIETHDAPPATEATHPTEPGLHEMDTVHIDGQVSAYYFSSGGYLEVYDGGFYTSAWPDADSAPADPAFWEIRTEGIAAVPAARMDLPFPHGGRTLRILFDYGVLNGRLAIRVWPEGLDADPVGNGWNAEPLGSRTDVVLLTIPVLSGHAYTHDLFLLDLKTQNITPLITNLPILPDAYRMTEDLRCAIIAGTDPASDTFGYWLYNMQTRNLTQLGKNVQFAWFLDDATLAFREQTEDGSIRLTRCHIPSGVRHVILEDGASHYRPIRNHWADGSHGLLDREDGTVSLIDFHTGDRLELSGLQAENLICGESPDGSRIMLGYEEHDSFPSIGILDPETGVLKLLERDISGGSETFRGWLDNDTLIITAHDLPDGDLDFTPGDGYYVYVYRFQEEQEEPPSPTVSEPADDTFVRVTDYIPDLLADLRYAGEDNFTGQRIYDFSDAWLRYGTVKKLMAVQAELRGNGLRLKIWDGFRPPAAQFRLWEICPDPTYVSDPTQGFSSHSRGGTVDVTLTYSDGRELEMPTGFDDFSARADRDYSDCTPEAAANAGYLEQLMQRHGFRPYAAEWWHYTDTQSYPVEPKFQPEG